LQEVGLLHPKGPSKILLFLIYGRIFILTAPENAMLKMTIHKSKINFVIQKFIVGALLFNG
jgi:hypothetical protein